MRARTFTPNFSRFEQRPGGGPWEKTSDETLWKLQRGFNRLEVRWINRFEVPGPVSEVFVKVE